MVQAALLHIFHSSSCQNNSPTSNCINSTATMAPVHYTAQGFIYNLQLQSSVTICSSTAPLYDRHIFILFLIIIISCRPLWTLWEDVRKKMCLTCIKEHKLIFGTVALWCLNSTMVNQIFTLVNWGWPPRWMSQLRLSSFTTNVEYWLLHLFCSNQQRETPCSHQSTS